MDQLYHSIHMFDCFFIKNFFVDLLYDSIHMFVCLSKTLTGSEVRYTVVLFFQIKTLFCQKTKYFV